MGWSEEVVPKGLTTVQIHPDFTEKVEKKGRERKRREKPRVNLTQFLTQLFD